MQGLYKVGSNLEDRQVLSEEDIEDLLSSLDEKENESKAILKYKELVKKLKSENEKLKGNVTKLKSNISELKTDKEELRESLSQYRQKEKQYDKSLAEKVKEYDKKIIKLEDEKISLKKEFETKFSDLEDEYEEKIIDLEKENARIEKQFQRDINIRVKELKKEFSVKEEEYKDKIEDLELKNKLLAQQTIKLQKVCRTVSDEMDNHIAEILTSVEEISKLKSFIVSETEVPIEDNADNDEEYTAKFLDVLSDLRDNDTISVKQIRELISKK